METTPDPPTHDDRQMAMLCHLLGFAGLFVPFGNFIGPLVVWLLKKTNHPFIDDQGKEALNFQITFTLIGLVLLSGFIFVLISNTEAFFRWISLLVLNVLFFFFYIILMIIAPIKSSQGQYYRYPLTLRLIA